MLIIIIIIYILSFYYLVLNTKTETQVFDDGFNKIKVFVRKDPEAGFLTQAHTFSVSSRPFKRKTT